MKIFVSYRRADSEPITNRLAQVFKRHFGRDNVVLDTDTFLLGNDFRAEIMQHLAEADVVLVVIGEFWHSIMMGRQEDPNITESDWVIKEIETALNTDKRVIPVLVDGVGVPPDFMLPESIREISHKNGFPIMSSPYRFSDSAQRLIQKIEESTGAFAVPQSGTPEYLSYLLINSSWSPQHRRDGNTIYLSEVNNSYGIVVDTSGEDSEKNYTSEWADHFLGKHRTYPVYVEYNGQQIAKTYFVSVWGAKYFVPLPDLDGTVENPIYFWDVHSLELKLARHIARFHTVYKTIEAFAEHAEIEIRE